MEMWRRVVASVHPDGDAIQYAESRHAGTIRVPYDSFTRTAESLSNESGSRRFGDTRWTRPGVISPTTGVIANDSRRQSDHSR